jgi:uncharacterized protein (TIGR02444 family)
MSSPFWTFSLAVYGANGVQDECLDLQDCFGLDVNLVLLCAFLGAAHGVALSADDIAAVRREADAWHEDIVKPLRAARRKLKTVALKNVDTAQAAAQLRTQVKAAELESERIEQMLLEQWAGARFASRPRGQIDDAILANLRALLLAYGIGPERLDAARALQHIIAAARQYAS